MCSDVILTVYGYRIFDSDCLWWTVEDRRLKYARYGARIYSDVKGCFPAKACKVRVYRPWDDLLDELLGSDKEPCVLLPDGTLYRLDVQDMQELTVPATAEEIAAACKEIFSRADEI